MNSGWGDSTSFKNSLCSWMSKWLLERANGIWKVRAATLIFVWGYGAVYAWIRMPEQDPLEGVLFKSCAVVGSSGILLMYGNPPALVPLTCDQIAPDRLLKESQCSSCLKFTSVFKKFPAFHSLLPYNCTTCSWSNSLYSSAPPPAKADSSMV